MNPPAPMKSSAPAEWATIGAVLVYTIAALLHAPPILSFLPALQSFPVKPAIAWYSWLVFDALAGVSAGLVGHFLGRRPPWIVTWLAIAASLVALILRERHWFPG